MKIILADYQTKWTDDFLDQKVVIGEALAGFNATIEHIGSTSIPGLCAKPTIDILVGLPTENLLDDTVIPMVTYGYTYFRKYETNMPYRRLFSELIPLVWKMPPVIIDLQDEFVRGEDFTSAANVHIIVKDTEHWHRHLAFRDYLRVHARISDEYGQLKRELSKYEFKDTNDYNAAKHSFIKRIQAQALVWYAGLNNAVDGD